MQNNPQNTTQAAVVPVTPVVETWTIHRKFHMLDDKTNANKEWVVRWNADTLEYIAEWGAVGQTKQQDKKSGVDRHFVEKKIAEKEKKGYKEIPLAVPQKVVVSSTPDGTQSTQPVISKEVENLISFIFDESSQKIQSYLNASVDAMAQSQIEAGRQLLAKVQKAFLSKDNKTVESATLEYFRTIPTKLPRPITVSSMVSVITDFMEQEDRLNQLEAAIQGLTYTVQGSAANNTILNKLKQLGGTEFDALSTSTNAYSQIHDMIMKTRKDWRGRVLNIFKVKIPKERAAFEAETLGASYITNLFHGTRNPNIRHIMSSGLTCPRVPANGRRFGDGVYFADMFARSLNYTGNTKYNAPLALFVASVKLGKFAELNGDKPSLKAAPMGYDSVRGVGAWSGMDEWIVYKDSQQTIKYMVLIDSR